MKTLEVSRDVFRLAEVFTISRGSRTTAEVLTATVSADGFSGCGECVPYARYGETLDSVEEQIRSLSNDLANGMDRIALQSALPAGAARNALDCALWDLQAKASGKPVWQLAGLPEPASVVSAYTLSLGDAASMQAKASEHSHRPLLKIKLGSGAEDVERIQAVRRGAPQTTIIVDANEGWSCSEYEELAPVLLELGVAMVEQPLPSDDDDALASMQRPLPVCADESCHDSDSLAAVAGKYDVVNIKLDKTGGLTEALVLRDKAMQQGYDVMVGCMVGSSLAMAPAVLVAQGAKFVDLDGPLLLAEDRTPALQFTGSVVTPAVAELWG